MVDSSRNVIEDALESLHSEISRGRQNNLSARDELPSPSSVVKLEVDSGYLKVAVYWLGGGIFAIFLLGWQLFLYLDGKLERKADYLNGRIDSVVMESLKRPAVPEVIKDKLKARVADGPVKRKP